jgi:hypothetical protein
MPQYQVQPQSWHFDRRIQITHILASLSFIFGGVFYLAQLRAEVDALQADIVEIAVAQAARDQRQDGDLEKHDALLRAQLTRIEAKLDRLIENNTRGGVK